MCSYCGCQSITVIGRFMAEHEECVNALGDLRRAVEAGDPDVEQRGQRVADLLFPHTDAEEVGLFHVMRRQEEFVDHIDSLCAEHTSLDDLLRRIMAGEHALMPAFDDLLREHINREENGLFPASAIALAGAEWDEIDELTPPG